VEGFVADLTGNRRVFRLRASNRNRGHCDQCIVARRIGFV
jgi:hypothetical protein